MQTQVSNDDTREYVRAMVRATWPRAYKVLDGGVDRELLEEMCAHGLELVVGRHWFPESGNADEVEARCDKMIAWANQNLLWLKSRGVRVVLEVPYNEELQNGEALTRLNDLTLRAMPRIMAAGYDVGIGVFSEGNPSGQGDPDPFVDWPRFHPALRLAQRWWKELPDTKVFLCLHEYGVPSLGALDGWHNFRYRKVWERLPADCRIPILITESGIDGGIEGRKEQGWRAYMDARQYAAWLWQTRTELDKDDYVWFSFVFLCGGNRQWEKFDVRDEVDLRSPLTRAAARPRWTPTKEAPVPTLAELQALARVAIAKYHLDEAVIFRQVAAESNWNPNAVSPSGAKGLMQLMDGTAAGLGVHDPFDPAQNLDGGCHYMDILLKRYGGNYEKALAAYNWGPGNLDRTLAAHPTNWKAYISAQATRYLAKINPPTEVVPVFDISKVRDQLWAIAETLGANGYPWTSQALKAVIALSKGEH